MTDSAMTARHTALLKKIIDDLRRRRTKPQPVTHSDSWEDDRVGQVMEYFDGVKNRVSPHEFQRLIIQFEQANREYLKRPPVQRQSFPLVPPLKPEDLQNPLCIKEMPVLSQFTPRTGGPRSSPEIAKRRALIQECKNKGFSDLSICKALDTEKIPVPKHWSRGHPGARSWAYFYRYQDARYRQRISRNFSEVARKVTHS